MGVEQIDGPLRTGNGKAHYRQHYYLTFSRRNPKRSNWTKPNIERAERMIKEGRITEQGQRLIDLAKETGKWKIKNP